MAGRATTSQVKVSQTCHLVLFNSALANRTSRKSFLYIFAPQMREELPPVLTPYVPKPRAATTLVGNHRVGKNYFTNLGGSSTCQVDSQSQVSSTQTLGEESEAGGGRVTCPKSQAKIRVRIQGFWLVLKTHLPSHEIDTRVLEKNTARKNSLEKK